LGPKCATSGSRAWGSFENASRSAIPGPGWFAALQFEGMPWRYGVLLRLRPSYQTLSNCKVPAERKAKKSNPKRGRPTPDRERLSGGAQCSAAVNVRTASRSGALATPRRRRSPPRRVRPTFRMATSRRAIRPSAAQTKRSTSTMATATIAMHQPKLTFRLHDRAHSGKSTRTIRRKSKLVRSQVATAPHRS
jgi:hypothetical protein